MSQLIGQSTLRVVCVGAYSWKVKVDARRPSALETGQWVDGAQGERVKTSP